MYRSSVEKSTKRTYKTAELWWVKLTNKRIGTDPFMRTKTIAWLAGELSFANTTVTWEETCGGEIHQKDVQDSRAAVGEAHQQTNRNRPLYAYKKIAWLAGELSFANTTVTWEETCVLAFLESTRHKPLILPPATAFNYLSIIWKSLQNGGVISNRRPR
jgi:hypothetical protein